MNKNTKSQELYISDLTEAEPLSRKMGDQQVLIAGDKEVVENYKKSGNQSNEYYKK